MATPSGIPQLGDLAAGAHIGQLYRDQNDLLETLVPFFAAGLAQNERCIWVTASPLCATDARAALASLVRDLPDRESRGEIEIIDHSDWYTKSGSLTPEQVIQAWLDAEERALRDGYRGLRVSGNTFWLQPGQWAEFAEYEERVHAAFKGRNIVALCSYALTKCDSHEVVDVLRNHSVSLVRNSDRWEVVHGATAALASLEPDRARHSRPHTVEFYRETYPANRIADRLVTALRQGHGAAALISREHGTLVRAELTGRGVDVEDYEQHGQLAFLDADAIFEEAWTRPGLNTDVVAARVLQPVLRLIAKYGAVVAYGELVDLFANAGDRQGALDLERWWNVQVAKHPIELACGYSLGSFGGGDSVDAFKHVCNEHVSVGVDQAATGSEADRLRAELAQVTTALANEMSRRQFAETAYDSAREAREQLVRLERLAAALGEVTTRIELVDVVTDIVATTLGTDGLIIVEHHDNGEPTTLVGHGTAVDALRTIALSAGSRPVWCSHADHQLPPPLQSYAVLPLQAIGTRLGSCVLGFTNARDFSATYRALAQDVARQLALALDRSTTYEHLEHERQRAEDASRAKDEFLAMLGHELRNPLSPILTATQLMRLRGGDTNERERVVIERQVKHMIRLVDDLLDVSRITRGKVDLRRRAVELSEVVSQAVELASPLLEERAHRLALDVPESGVVVHADPQRLAQVLSNLLCNAAKYTPQGGDIRLAVHATSSAVTVSVRDNGIGIDQKLLPNIFELFVQGRQGIDRAGGGLGLGLAIAKSLLEMHGGSIRVHSDGLNKGSEFTIELPRFANTRPSRSNVSGGFAIPQVRGRRVLIVDDNEDAAFLFSEALKRLGHHVDVAYDGPTALACARQHPPEIAFLDIGLPVMDGYELGRRLRDLCVTKPPRLIAVTGYGHTSDKERSREAGFELHLVKPIELATVQDALAKLE